MKKNIIEQLFVFIDSDLLGKNESFTEYAIVTSIRSLYTSLESGFISKQEAIDWIEKNYFKIDKNNSL